MSGPKTSRYTLTAEQRRLLAEQRDIQRKMQKNSALLKQNIAELKEIIVKVDSELAQYKRIASEIGNADLQLNGLEATRNQAMKTLNDAGVISEKKDLKALESINEKLREITIVLVGDETKISSKLKKVDEAFKKEINHAISEGFTISFIRIKENEEDVPNLSNYMSKIEGILEEISTLQISCELIRKFEQLKSKAAEIESVDFMENFYAMSIIPFLKDCHAYNSLYLECGAKYEDLYLEYKVLTDELGITQKQYAFSLESIGELEKAIHEMQQKIQKKEEQEYISKCVDEAMREMGYKVIGEREVARKDGRKFTNELYLFDEGTAVNVTYSDEGQITMELGGLDNKDRIPSEEECQSLALEMGYFCDDYLKIEERLKAMGVISHRVSILPPEAQFAQIINMSDFKMTEEVTNFESRKTRRALISQEYLRKDD